MKIERINDNQIRCTLTRSDLDDRHLQISELVIGSEKARELFREMMQMAYEEHGFDAENIPLMVEAVPVSPDCLVLVVTKVENPDELNTRFSDAGTDEEGTLPTADKFLDYLSDMIRKEREKKEDSPEAAGRKQKSEKTADGKDDDAAPVSPPSTVLFAFSSMEDISALCALIEPFYDGDSAFYRHPSEPDFYLILKKPGGDRRYFDRACRIACDFGSIRPFGYASEAFFQEHYRCLIPEDAVQTLSSFEA